MGHGRLLVGIGIGGAEAGATERLHSLKSCIYKIKNNTIIVYIVQRSPSGERNTVLYFEDLERFRLPNRQSAPNGAKTSPTPIMVTVMHKRGMYGSRPSLHAS